MKKKAGDPPKKKSNASSRASFDSDNAVRRSKATSDNLQKVDRVYREGLKSAGEHNARGIPGREKPYNQVRDEVMPRPKMEYMGKNKPSYMGGEKPRPSPLKPLGPVGRAGGGPKKSTPKKSSNYMGATMTPAPKAYVKKVSSESVPKGKKGKMK